MKNILITLLVALIFGTVGFLSLFKAKNIQIFILKYYNENRVITGFNPLIRWMKSNQYGLSLKIAGILGMCAFIFLLFCIIMMVIDIIS